MNSTRNDTQSSKQKKMKGTLESFRLTPENTVFEALSPLEINALFAESREQIHELLCRCVLAVLNSGNESDDVEAMLDRYREFDLEVIKTAGGIELELMHAPLEAFVEYEYLHGQQTVRVHKIIEGIRQNIFAVLRDIVFIKTEIGRSSKYELDSSLGITDAVFMILRNAGVFRKTGRHKVIVCWGGHSLKREEYEYTKRVGYRCGLRFMDIITGCGPGAMKGPMKGATIAFSKQRYGDGRCIGITEPGIIASEAPNPIVNQLVIMPDIEKRLEAFLRLGHGIVIFPGGAGTAEELMYILGLLSHPKNADQPLPLVLTGPESAAGYFSHLDRFIRRTLGDEITSRYEIVINQPERVAQLMNQGLLKVKSAREQTSNSYFFNRGLYIPPIFQEPFEPSHDNVKDLVVELSDEPYIFAAALRRVFSAIVWGNVKPEGIASIAAKGPLQIRAEKRVMEEIDQLLRSFIQDRRMRLEGEYKPVYEMKPL